MKKSRAFTLLEILIAASLFSLVLLSIYSAFRIGILSYQKIDSASTVYRRARILFNRLESDLKNTFSYTKDDTRFKGTVSTLEFFSVVDFFEEGKRYPDVCRIKYAAQENGLQRVLFRGANALKEEAEALSVEALFPVDAVSFQYAVSSPGADLAYEWIDVWPKEGSPKNILPLALKVKLRVIEKDSSAQAGQSIELEKIIPLYRWLSIN
ncbi:MAG: prepilin-type N-terminal cleavage/methylation domain-containing protein [Candidatus Omnitrophica bacterium]|nr:prepilin-type N-terminal cleavage/methylation domain-containing protein [Candidatus Omnitrophota bacterium]